MQARNALLWLAGLALHALALAGWLGLAWLAWLAGWPILAGLLAGTGWLFWLAGLLPLAGWLAGSVEAVIQPKWHAFLSIFLAQMAVFFGSANLITKGRAMADFQTDFQTDSRRAWLRQLQSGQRTEPLAHKIIGGLSFAALLLLAGFMV
jgi:hypothetical protein